LGEQLRLSVEAVQGELLQVWPAASSGRPFSVAYQVEDGTVVLRTPHFGPPLGPATVEALERSLSATLKVSVRLLDDAMPAPAIERGKDDIAFLTGAAAALSSARRWPQVVVCVTAPLAPARLRLLPAARQFQRTFESLTADLPDSARAPGTNFAIRLQLEPCATASEH
jgi:hypothetical protein